jgi:hypothetical protein
MSENNFDALFNQVPSDDVEADTSTEDHNEVAETQEEKVSEEQEAQAEDAHEETALESEPTEEEDDEGKVSPTVPLPTFLGIKDKYRDEKAERIAAQEREAALKKQLEEFQRNAPKESQAPDPFHDPRGYADYRFKELESQRINDKIMMSGEFAKRTHGEEAVVEAAKWAAARTAHDPHFDALVAGQPDPMEWVIQQHKAARQLEDFQRDPEAFARRIAEEKGWLTAQPVVTETATVATQKERKLPKSLSDVPAASAARVKPISEGKAFNDLFN